ncbi:MAG TPA: hypothetical protein VE754_03825, partial [Actinomycetota bacterium]|nr:hypothetical protein [Actinomycetota bacterium]
MPHETDENHDHDDHDEAPGHTHAAYAETAPGGMAVRVVLTIVGAGLMIVGAFLDWLVDAGTRGIDAEANVFWSTDVAGEANFLTSAGA